MRVLGAVSIGCLLHDCPHDITKIKINKTFCELPVYHIFTRKVLLVVLIG